MLGADFTEHVFNFLLRNFRIENQNCGIGSRKVVLFQLGSSYRV